MPYPEHESKPAVKSEAPKATAAPVKAGAKADAPKPVADAIKDAKAAVAKAPDGDLKDEAQRNVDQAEAFLAEGKEDRAAALAKQAVAVLQ